MPRDPAADRIFLALDMAPLPVWAGPLLAASAALPDRRPAARAETLPSLAGLEARLAEGGAVFVLAPLSAAAALEASLAAGGAPFATLARWQALARGVLALRDRHPALCLLPPGLEPGAALARIGMPPPALPVAKAEPALPAEAPSQDSPSPEALIAALVLRHDAITASLMAELGAPEPAADPAALDRAAQAALAGAADLRQRLLERDTQLREHQQTDAAALRLLRDQMAAQQAGFEAAHLAQSAERAALNDRIAALMSSTSWRITAPLRRLRGG